MWRIMLFSHLRLRAFFLIDAASGVYNSEIRGSLFRNLLTHSFSVLLLRLHAAFAPAPSSHLQMDSPPPLRWWERGRDLQNMKDVCGPQDFLDEMVRTRCSWSVWRSALEGCTACCFCGIPRMGIFPSLLGGIADYSFHCRLWRVTA